MDVSEIINEFAEERESYFNSVAVPIFQTSNFSFKKVDDLGRAFESEMDGYLYSRGLNPTVDVLRKKLAALDGAEDCLVYNSGAAATFVAILANVKAGDHVVSVRAPYTWTQRMLDVILPRFGVTCSYIPGDDIAQWEEATRPNTSLYVLESPNSWTYAIQDLAAVSVLARKKGIITYIDNSYCTPLYQKPIEMGIDIVMQTATKYISGHSDTLGGVLSGSKEMMHRIFNSEHLTVGSGIQPFNAWLLIRGLRTLPMRLAHITRSTREVLQFLKEHPKVDKVFFPLDPDFPQFALAQKQMKDACGLMTLELKATKRSQIVTFCESLQHIMMAVSWGGHESLIVPGCATVAEADFDPGNPAHRSVRLYVGLEDPGYLIDDLAQALEKVK